MNAIVPTVVRFLAALVIPIAVVTTVFGLLLIGKSTRGLTRRRSVQNAPFPSPGLSPPTESGSTDMERVAVGLCALLALAGVAGLVTSQVRRNPGFHPWILVWIGLIIIVVAPALLWHSRWRVFAEGLAAVALSVAAVITGFSIGFAFVPLLAAMSWVCYQHLRADTRNPPEASTVR